MDLEEEFQKLMQGVVNQIQDRVTKGNLSSFDGADLVRMVRERTAPAEEAWSSSTQSCMDSYEYEDSDEGWNRSGQAC
jgi:hypothetical protein